MNLLSFHTATNICSVALFSSRKLIDIESSSDDKSHSKYLGVYVDKILSRNSMDISSINNIAIASGPGSFTGLRIGFSLIKGLIFDRDIPVILVPTLHSLEENCLDIDDHFIVLYSHSNMVYAQRFKNCKAVSEILYKPIDSIKHDKIYGYGLKNKVFSIDYINVVPSAKLVGLSAIKNYELWAENDINKICPNYVSNLSIGP